MNKGVAIVAAVLVAAGIAYWFLRPRAEPPPPPAETAAPKPPPDVALPAVESSDAQVRGALGNVSHRPEWAQWLKQDDLLNTAAVVVDNLAEDASPRRPLAFLAPAQRFHADDSGAQPKMDPKGYERYDVFADVIGSIDAKALAAAVHGLHPLLETAYHRLGYPDRRLDDVVQKALKRLADAPVADAPPALIPKGALWLYQDEKLEALGPVEKHLLRMGPRNTRIIQLKAREVASALALPL